MMTLERVGAFLAALFLLSIYLPGASAQQSTSVVTIKVTDRSGALIPKAQIRIVPYPLELSRKLITDLQGVVNVQLAAGRYEVFVRATAFQPSSRRFEVVDANNQTVMISLAVGEGSGPVLVRTAPLAGDEQRVWELEQAFWKYAADLDVDKYEALWEQNAVAWDHHGYYLIGKKDAIAWLKDHRSAAHQLYEYDLISPQVRVIGDTAVVYYWVTTLWVDKLGQGQTRRQRVAHTWTKVDRQWRLVGEFLDSK